MLSYWELTYGYINVRLEYVPHMNVATDCFHGDHHHPQILQQSLSKSGSINLVKRGNFYDLKRSEGYP